MNIQYRITNIECGNFFKNFGKFWLIQRSILIVFFSVVFSYEANAQHLQKIYTALDNATSLSVTQNSIYIVEQGKNRLLKLDHTGKLLDTIGGKGSGNYQFSKPVDVDGTNGLKIFITDYNNRRIQVFVRRGQYLSSIAGHSSFGNNRKYEPTQLSVNSLGEVFFVDEYSKQILRYDLDYNLLDEFRIPSEIRSVDDLKAGNGWIYILEVETDTIHELEMNGSYKGFYPAGGTTAFFVNNDTIWEADENALIRESRDPKPNRVEFDQQIQVVNIHVLEKTAYILSRNTLYKMALN